VPALAYMDDTLWMADSRTDLQNIMALADSFFTLNSIQVNWDKSVLLTNTRDTSAVNFTFNDKDVWLSPLSHKDSTRYLGVWISLFDNTSYIKNQVVTEFKKVKNVLDKKRLTAKQIVAVFNSVIIPRIIYKTKLTFLPANFCNILMASFRAFFKNKLRLTKQVIACPHYSLNIWLQFGSSL
jgi:hypothetical protein